MRRRAAVGGAGEPPSTGRTASATVRCLGLGHRRGSTLGCDGRTRAVVDDARRREDPEEEHRSHGHEAIERGRSRGLGLATGPRARGCGGEPRPARCRNAPPGPGRPRHRASVRCSRSRRPGRPEGGGSARGSPVAPRACRTRRGSGRRRAGRSASSTPLCTSARKWPGRSTTTVPASRSRSTCRCLRRAPASASARSRTSAASSNRLCVGERRHLLRAAARGGRRARS